MAKDGGTTTSGGTTQRKGPAQPVTFRMRQILQLLPEGVVLLDRSGRILDLNHRAAELFDHPVDVLRGEELERLYLGARRDDGRPFAAEELPGRRALLSGVPQTGVVMGVARPDRDVLWLEVNAVPLGSIEDEGPVVLVSFRDISDHRRAEEEIRFQAGLLDAAAEAIIATDLQLNVTYCNAGTESLLQRTRDETVGALASAFVAPGRRDDIERMEHLLTEGLVIRDFETVVRRADGSDIDVSLSVTAQTTAQGEPIGAIAIIRDVSERVRSAREAEAHAKRAAEAERLAAEAATERAAAERANEAKSALLSRMSHELRTPLNSVLGFAQLLEDSELADPVDRRSVAQIIEAGGRLLELVDEVLEFSQAAEEARRAGDGSAPTIDLDQLAIAGGGERNAPLRRRTEQREERDLTILFVDPDPKHLQAVEEVVAPRPHVNLVTTTEGRHGVELAHAIRPDLMLISAGMHDLAPREVLAMIRADAATESTCVMVVNPLTHPDGVQRDPEGADSAKPLDLVRSLTLIDGLTTRGAARGAA